MPLLIAFSLLLLLNNVSLSFESYELTPSDEVIAVAAPSQIKNVISNASTDGGILLQMVFACTDNNSCQNIKCSGGPIYTLQVEFEYIWNWCGNKYFDVIIEDCTFNQNTISRSTFSGSFKLSTLTIRNCQLDTIADNAFNYKTLNKLTNLTFVDVQLKSLNAQTFLGLEAVENFQLFNALKQVTLPLNASNFLQPMATSLSNLVLLQTEESCCSNAIYDPTEWLGGNSATVYSKLTYVDLSGTKFNDTLNGNTFAKLSAVQELRLVNCSLSRIAENVFTGILSTLKSLDLRYNRLQTLDGEFLGAAISKGIIMELGWNMWRCDCDNMETIEYMKQIENNSAANTVCATPTHLAGTQIRFAQLRCHDTTTLTTIMTNLTTIGVTTTIAMETKTTMVTTTDYTTREPTKPISKATSTSISSTNTITASTLPISTADITSTTASDKTEDNTDSTTIISADTTTTTSSSITSIVPTTLDESIEVTTESNSKTSSTSSTTANDNSTFPTSASGTSISPTTTVDRTEKTTESNSETPSSPFTNISADTTTMTSSSITIIVPTTLDDSTEVTTESNSKTSSTSSTTANDNSNFPTSSSATSITSTTTVDRTEETTESNSEIPPTSSTTPNNDTTVSTTSSDTSKMPTTSDSTIINTTQSNSENPSKSSTTTNHNPISSTSSFATSITPTTNDDRTEETTESNAETSETTSAITINQPTLSTSSSTAIMTLATPHDKVEETTVSASSGAASIHRW
ncbi:PREDICTED: uncharacterized threonine-rich GPI-anchored glycoprotein PJ4664.02-like [Bactrocera latifrons]|uniref:uncharacterized threonine-rich GPI-anchored glycoprotein PJ4664.02-like n=1 Tax=Bactrocera latifrons TaxID=174628 RepID=UPI0008DE9756|nr:PREDICTED: uncharacterized threonine-rich GPI-anchored glycoprotein PJ4664.02-like [Bactrocera latifrons]